MRTRRGWYLIQGNTFAGGKIVFLPDHPVDVTKDSFLQVFHFALQDPSHLGILKRQLGEKRVEEILNAKEPGRALKEELQARQPTVFQDINPELLSEIRTIVAPYIKSQAIPGLRLRRLVTLLETTGHLRASAKHMAENFVLGDPIRKRALERIGKERRRAATSFLRLEFNVVDETTRIQ
ncbi:MAG: hypothetical protein K2X47_08305, partial [Bdellovibrionales bacterium]|nr:hypothetical protein [Bdellovibrionales bacterium]